MSTTLPIKDPKRLKEFKNYYLTEQPNLRNYFLIIIGLNTALRIGDILSLRWGDIYDFKRRGVRKHIDLTEQKTKKQNCIAINDNITNALHLYRKSTTLISVCPHTPLFCSQKGDCMPLSRYQAFRIIKQAAEAVGFDAHISCHSLRKTFGYHAWKQGASPVLLMKIYNHSSFDVTRRYLSIEQEDKDMIFQKIKL